MHHSNYAKAEQNSGIAIALKTLKINLRTVFVVTILLAVPRQEALALLLISLWLHVAERHFAVTNHTTEQIHCSEGAVVLIYSQIKSCASLQYRLYTSIILWCVSMMHFTVNSKIWASIKVDTFSFISNLQLMPPIDGQEWIVIWLKMMVRSKDD